MLLRGHIFAVFIPWKSTTTFDLLSTFAMVPTPSSSCWMRPPRRGLVSSPPITVRTANTGPWVITSLSSWKQSVEKTFQWYTMYSYSRISKGENFCEYQYLIIYHLHKLSAPTWGVSHLPIIRCKQSVEVFSTKFSFSIAICKFYCSHVYTAIW